jgi:REP element-mobilizing transposase RayT
MSDIIPTAARWRSQLPHWEVRGHWHFVTIRCEGSLPKEGQEKVKEIHRSLQRIEAHDPAFARLQRQYFLTTEKYIDTAEGFAPLTTTGICGCILSAFEKIEDDGWHLGEAVIMPNHVHFVMIQQSTEARTLKQTIERFKGRSARWANQQLERKGRFWQEDWFDRWMRHEDELARTIRYVRQNPVKAKLTRHWKDYPWRLSRFPDET